MKEEGNTNERKSCQHCGHGDLVAFVAGGSYGYECPKCRTVAVATSWISIVNPNGVDIEASSDPEFTHSTQINTNDIGELSDETIYIRLHPSTVFTCTYCGNTAHRRTHPPGIEISSMETWKCENCGHSVSMTVSYSDANDTSESDELVNCWYSASTKEEIVLLAKHLSTSALDIHRGLKDGRLCIGPTCVHEAEYLKMRADEDGVQFAHEKLPNKTVESNREHLT